MNSYALDQQNEILRPKSAASLFGISTVTLWRLDRDDPTFPKKVRFSARCVGYRRGDLLAFLETKMMGGKV